MRRLVSCCVAMGAFGAIMAPSALADNNFSCRGSAARVQAPVVNLVEPVAANKPNDPCAAESNTLIPISVPANGSILKAPTANAVTTNAASQATAFGSVENATANVGIVSLTADIIQANAAASCGSGGQVQFTGSSQITGLVARALGLPVNVPINPAPNTVLINLLGIKVTLNEQTIVNGETIIRAIHVSAPGLGTDVVIAEARADFHGSPCTAPPVTQCNDGVDNADAEDSLVDAADPGCHVGNNPSNPYDPTDNNETNPTPPQCSDGLDNDMDGAVDFPADPGCSDSNDNNESNTIPKTDCHDGIDNDLNGKTDYPEDPGCTSAYDNSEGSHQG